MSKPLVSVIIPFLNESESITPLTKGLTDFFEKSTEFSGEVIFVDDGSTDNSVALLKKAAHTSYKAKVISLSKNFGSHAALRAGILNSSGDFICFIYADLQDPLSLINQLYAESVKGNDIVWAKRNSSDNKLVETFFSRMYSGLMKKYVSNQYPEQGFDVVLFNTKVKAHLNSQIEGHSSIFLQILVSGFKQASIFYHKEARKQGVSKWTVSKKLKLLLDSFIAFSYAPIRFVSVMGILFFLVGIVWSTYLVVRKLIYNDLESGWPALMSVILLGFGLTNISLGIIAEYLWCTHDAARKRPVFVIDQIEELN